MKPGPKTVPSGRGGARVSMADIARAAHVHRSTVSLALRHQSKIPAATRERILRFAGSLGYTPDPLLDAFNFQRLTAHPGRGSPGIAFISDEPSREAFDASPLHREAFRGAKELAASHGFSVDLFLTGPGQLSPERLERVLQSRGVFCAIVGAVSRRTRDLPLDWARYCVVAIESFHLQPALDSVTLDYRTAARHAVRQLQAAGHRRIGFVSSADEDLRLQHLPLSGYLLEIRRCESAALPPLLLTSTSGGEAAAPFRGWIRRNRPTAIVAGCRLTVAAVRERRWPLPVDVEWYGLTGSVRASDPAGAPALYRNLGARAAELLPLRRQVNQRGLPKNRTTIVLPP